MGAGKGPFGCPSDPAVFVEALAPLGEVTTISGEDAARKGVLTRKNVDLLVVPTGSAWPMAAAGTLVSYLREGGSLLTCGGYAFDVPAERRDGAWRAWELPPLPAATDPVALPAAARRPLNSRLSCEEGEGLLPPWEDALARCIAELRRRGGGEI